MDNWERMKAVVTDIRNFRSKYGCKEMTVHFHESILKEDEDWLWALLDMSESSFLSKLAKATPGYIFDDYSNVTYYPLVSGSLLLFIETPTEIYDYEDTLLKEMGFYKKQYLQSVAKLSSKFIDNAPTHIVENERNKLRDFGKKWELTTIAFMRYN